jgi:hypothetical protein
MNRNETKCAKLERYKTKAEADAVGARKKVKHLAYACECDGFHVVKVGKTRKQQRRAQYDDYYGDLLKVVQVMIERELRHRRR